MVLLTNVFCAPIDMSSEAKNAKWPKEQNDGDHIPLKFTSPRSDPCLRTFCKKKSFHWWLKVPDCPAHESGEAQGQQNVEEAWDYYPGYPGRGEEGPAPSGWNPADTADLRFCLIVTMNAE